MQIEIPEHISAEERQLYKQLRELNKKQNQKKHWWEKYKDKNW